MVARARHMNALQASAGNARIGRRVQAKLAVAPPGDEYEREADRVAAKVMRMEASPQHGQSGSVDGESPIRERCPACEAAQRKCAACEESEHRREERDPQQPADTIHCESTADGAAMVPSVAADLEARIQSPGGGRPLPVAMRTDMETAMGADFSNVRVHEGAGDRADADRLNAKAFTHGSDIWIGSSGSANDRQLMAHELTHVVQQGGDVRRQTASDDALRPTADAGPGVTPQADDTDVEAGAPASAPEDGKAADAISADAMPDQAADMPTPAPSTAEPETPSAAATEEGPTESPSVADADSSAANTGPATPAATEVGPSISTTSVEAEPTEGMQPAGDMTVGPQAPAAAVATITAAASSSAPPSPAPASPIGGGSIQREAEEGDDGLLGGIRRRITAIADGLRSGWSTLSGLAESSIAGIREYAGGVVSGLTSVISSALSVLQSTWQSITQRVTQVTRTVQQRVEAGLGVIINMVRTIGAAIVNLDADALRAAWARLTGLTNALSQTVRQVVQGVYQTIAGLWQGLRARFQTLFQSMATRARAAFAQVQAGVQGLRQRLSSAWAAMQARGSQITAAASGVFDRLRSLLRPLFARGEQLWTRIQQQWTALTARVAAMVQGIAARVTAVAQQLRERATSMWSRLQAAWTGLQTLARNAVQRAVSGVQSLWANIRGSAIGTLIDTLERVGPFFRAVRELVQNPNVIMRPIAEAIAGQIESRMPSAAEEQAREHMAGGGGRSPASTAATGSAVGVQRTPDDVAIQRQLMPSLDQKTIWSGFWEVLKDKWFAFWQHPVDNILKILWDMIAFWETVPRDVRGLISDVGRAVTRMTTAGLGFWRHLLDIVLIILRRITQILFDLYPLFLLLSVAVGAIAGAVGGAVGGAILTFMAGGVGAAPGTAVGFAGGAGVGLGFALGVGEALLWAYIAIEAATFLKAWGDLSLVDQLEEEQVEDLEQMVNSAIGLGIAIALVLLSALAGAIARGLKLRLRPGGRAEAFISGVQRGFRGGNPFRRGRIAPDEGGGGPKPGEELRVIEIESPTRLKSTAPEFKNGRWEWKLYDSETGAVFCDVYAEVPPGSPPGTAPTGGPRLTLTPREAVLPDGTMVSLKAKGFSWTPEALRLASEAYRQKFGVRPAELGGEIDWSNLQNFQIEYAKIREANPGMSPEQIGAQAAAKISFGTHRIALGYGDFRVRLGNFGDVTIQRPTGNVSLSNVPKDVYIEARPTQGGGSSGGVSSQ